ncbi:MAG: hypothetical protein HFJ30_08475 [Clostridia bacterium]|nr:hypothetical protein [Clostridia bacterium]
MGNSKSYESKYEKVSCFDEKGKSVFELHFKKLAENYHDFLAGYFIIEGGVLTDEFRFIYARG